MSDPEKGVGDALGMETKPYTTAEINEMLAAASYGAYVATAVAPLVKWAHPTNNGLVMYRTTFTKKKHAKNTLTIVDTVNRRAWPLASANAQILGDVLGC